MHHETSGGAAFHHRPGTGPRPAVLSGPFLALALVSITILGCLLVPGRMLIAQLTLGGSVLCFFCL